MIHAFLVLAASESEPSKTPFYIVGGAWAAFAVILSAIGLSQPDFPRGDGAARGVMLLSLVLMAAAMVTAVAVS